LKKNKIHPRAKESLPLKRRKIQEEKEREITQIRHPSYPST